MPPATNSMLNGRQAHAEVCQGSDFVTHSNVEVQPCAMHEWESGNRCSNEAMEDSDFCVEHADVKLCKASGIWHYSGGQNGKFASFYFGNHILPHPIDAFGPRTKRADFCSDRCRNLWRDTNPRRKRRAEISKLNGGERSERYEIIENYSNSGQTVLLDKQTGRVAFG